MKTQYVPFKVFSMASGEFSVGRFNAGRNQRWDVYPTRELATAALPSANFFARQEARNGGRPLHLSPLKEAA